MAAFARVLVEVEPDHLDRPFDYAIPEELTDPVVVGTRVEVVFGGRRTRGLVVGLTDESTARNVRPLRRVLGPHAWVGTDDLGLMRWAADRYAAPMADVIRHALPNRVVDVERRGAEQGWFPPGSSPRPPPPGQTPVGAVDWAAYDQRGAELLAAADEGQGAYYLRPVPGDDLAAKVTDLALRCLAGGRDVVLVVPGPTSAIADRVAAAVGDLAVDVRGSAGNRRLYRAWLRARGGVARVVIGEQGVAFWPVDRLGLAIVVDEASPALKARRSPYHHAREVALERARRANAVALLVGYVPSAEAWRLLVARRIRPVIAARAVERAAAPTVHVDDRSDGPRSRLSNRTMRAVRDATRAGHLVVVLAVRRGEGHALTCGDCGLRLACPVCGGSVRRHARRGTECPSCGHHAGGRARCERCGGGRFVPLAAGAERLGVELARTFHGIPVTVLEGYGHAPPPPPGIVVTTRGSVVLEGPDDVGAVVVPDLDALLRRPGLDASEDALRLAMTVSAWAAATPGGEVVVETREPEHHAVRALVRWDPGGYWQAEMGVRGELRFPPAAYAVRLDVPAGTDVAGLVASALPAGDSLLGPLGAVHRDVWLIKADDRVATVAALDPLRRTWSRDGRDIRIVVDPVAFD